MPSEQTSENDAAPAVGRMVRYLRWHGLAYFAVLVVLTIAHFLAAGNWSVFWPMLIWTVVLIVHHLIVKSIATDQSWVSERSSTIIHNATDLSHITSIREQYESRVARRTPETEAEEPGASSGDEAR